MPSSGQHRYHDPLVIQYLLGSASAEESDRLDELSIADDEFAAQLRSVENDLVDAYVKGELEGDTLQRFKSFYLASPTRVEKVRFAEALGNLTDRSPGVASLSRLDRGARRNWLVILAWSFAGAAALLLMAVSYLFVENRRLKDEFAREQSRGAALEQRAQLLQDQLKGQTASVRPQPTKAPVQRPAPVVLAFVLSPQTRGLGSVSTIAVPPGTDRVALSLTLESDDFPVYLATLKDPAVNQIIWRSSGLKAFSKGENRAVSVILPAALFKQQNYSLEVAGVAPGGKEEFVNGYAFRFTTK